MNQLNVMIVEDDELLRDGLEVVINGEADMAVAGTAGNGLEALAAISRNRPDIVLIDLQMPVMDGIACIREIRKTDKDLPILILTTFNEEQYILQALAYGANGYVLKGLEFAKLVQTVRDAAAGHYILPAAVAASIARYAMNNAPLIKEQRLADVLENSGTFSRKEREILQLLFNKLSNKVISEKLFISEGTIKNHLTVIYEKLNVQNRQQAIQRLEKIAEEARFGG